MPTRSRTPFLSAVVCSSDRAEPLRQMLESLCRHTVQRDAFEVVLIDDGSSDGTREVALAFDARLPLRYSYQRKSGVASARNHGLFMARGEVLLFLDGDDVADPGLLEAHIEAHRRFPETEIGVLGHTRLDPALAADPLTHFAAEVGGFLFSYPDLQDGDILDFTYFWGGRSSCKRSFLLDHGVFNPALGFGCEDIELGFRLSRRGFKVVYDSRAVTTMVRRQGFDDFCQRLRLQGQSSFVLSRLHQDEVLQQWTEVPRAAEAWRRFGPAYEAILRSGRELDRFVRMRLEMGLPVDTADIALLHRGYWAAFRASQIKGIVEKAAAMGQDLVDAGAPPPRSAAL